MKQTFALVIALVIVAPHTYCQQSDTSSYFPLGFWGIWQDSGTPPFNHQPIPTFQWTAEIASWHNINGNYLVAWIPDWVEDTLMSVVEQLGYRMDVMRSNYTFNASTDTSIEWWIKQAPNPPTSGWKQRALDKLNGIKNRFGSRQGFHTVFVGHETDMWDTNLWPAFKFVVDAWDSLMPDVRTKPYFVLGGGDDVYGGFNLQAFADYIPNLRMFSVDAYFFESLTSQTYQSQQDRFQGLVVVMDTTMKLLRNRPLEYWFTLQSQRSFGAYSFRRPSFVEQRTEAYLGLSRGAKGLNWFIYGSNTNDTSGALTLPSGGLGVVANTGYNGLVALNRQPWELSHLNDTAAYSNTARINAEILQLAPTIRKLRVYDAFPNTAIPSNNIAKITQVIGDKVEIGAFKRIDQGADSTVHFMLVNRVCNNTDGTLSSPQTVTTTFSLPSGNYEISEVVSGKIWIIANNGSFSDVLNPGSGKLYTIGPATWAGTKSVTGTATVASGAVLTVSPGASVTIRNSAALLVNGQLSAVGTSSQRITFDFLAPSSTAGNGIAFASGSSGSTISYCRVLRADRGIYENGVSINVTNSAIDSCTNGIYLYNSSPTVQNNSMYGNTYAGISLTASSPTLYNNYIQNNQYGVHCITSSNPQFGNGSTQGKNNITGNSYGVFCWDNSFPMLGRNSPLNGGYNNLVNALWNVYNMSGYPNYANNNWWGTTNPANFKINGTGTVLYDPYLTSSVNIPAPPLSKSGVNVYASNDSDIPMLSELDTAYQLIAANRLIEARKICLNLVTNYPDDGVSGIALNLLRETYQVSDVASVKDVYLSLFNSKEKNNLYAMAGLILADIDKENRLSLIDDVINAYKNYAVVELALFDKFVYYYFEKQDRGNALAISKALDGMFPSSQGAVEAHRILGDESAVNKDQNPKSSNDQTVSEYALLGNYPNPFNPSTTIRFGLPTAGNVSLIVYDVLGREVTTLVRGTLDAGYHTATWNALSVASGVYFARLTVTNEFGRIAFNKVTKLLLMK
jgi:parallel beta-helix repeat protein